MRDLLFLKASVSGQKWTKNDFDFLMILIDFALFFFVEPLLITDAKQFHWSRGRGVATAGQQGSTCPTEQFNW